ncbi:hypothetical protein HMPREF0063_11334 [Aeromicrobium marinum DSM 15272]|uniref:Type IV toxin-antitoxin system AbiEi family antitoxin domain-containing protein n=1 Tax=Aeromicrobium marinum DSM 15272 TaxID=585531 RepID=E2SBC5_9ACTN|nr:hypothetical protein [Aeromicrobium marinum]EFQ83671.1 hypothetical protein HMPREF0063_11334 [Aeromicrobium marinum DSM 15272]
MDDITAVIEVLGGSIERHEILDLGWNDRQIGEAVRGGLLTRIRYGTYAATTVWDHSSPGQRLQILTRAVIGKLGRHVVASHHSAAALHGFELFGVDLERVHLTRLDGRTGRIDAGVQYHRGRLDETELIEIDGCLVVRPDRAVIESALISGTESAMVVASSYLRGTGGGRGELLEVFDAHHADWPGSIAARSGLARADARFESVGEVRTGHLFHRFAIEAPEPQFTILDAGGRFVARCDFGWRRQRHVGEFDGMVKYGRLNPDPGDPGRVLVGEKRREDEIRDLGFGVSRVTWADLAPGRAAATAARIRADVDRSARITAHRLAAGA